MRHTSTPHLLIADDRHRVLCMYVYISHTAAPLVGRKHCGLWEQLLGVEVLPLRCVWPCGNGGAAEGGSGPCDLNRLGCC